MKITLDGVRKDVGVERTADGFLVTVEDRRLKVSDVSTTGGTPVFLIDHASHAAHVSRGRKGLDISISGRTYAHTRDEVDSDRPVAAHGDGRVEAPMPGSIVAVNVAVGDKVKAGDAVAVLESMKMHNELLAPVTGTVKHINCRKGEQVAYGQVLVEIGDDT